MPSNKYMEEVTRNRGDRLVPKGTLGALGYGVASNVPFMAELQAGLRNAVGPGGDYEQYRNQYEQNDMEAMSENPMAYGLGSVGAGALPGIGAMGWMSKAQKAKQLEAMVKAQRMEEQALRSRQFARKWDNNPQPIIENRIPESFGNNFPEEIGPNPYTAQLEATAYQRPIPRPRSNEPMGTNYFNEGVPQPRIYGSGRTQAQIDKAYELKKKMWAMMRDDAEKADLEFMKYKKQKLEDYGTQFDVVPLPEYGTKTPFKK